MNDEIEKPINLNPDDVLAAIQSFNDPAIITNMFRDLGWSYSIEIRETVMMAQQNANLSIKFKALKHLRELLREAAETSGYVANVSSTTPNLQGGTTTFSAKRIAGVLNPVKKIESTEIKESQNDKSKHTEPNRESDRAASRETEDTNTQFPAEPDSPTPERDTGRDASERDVGLGGTKPPDGGEIPGPRLGDTKPDGSGVKSKSENPCIKVRPPTGDQRLFPGIASADE